LIIFSTFLPCRQAADDLPHRFRRETIQARQSGSIIQLQPSATPWRRTHDPTLAPEYRNGLINSLDQQ
jgi:hypothetical protein